MSLSAPPNQPQPPPPPQPAPPPTLKQRLARESRHWADMPPQRFALLVLPICVLVFLCPPLPVVAYALWLWASSSWAWRDRWASIWALARRGGAFVAFVFLAAALNSAQVWIFPQLIATLQAFWRAHLPGELSLTPLLEPSLVARTLLLLPLAPALALYFERVDPRTRIQYRRILTPRDLEPKPAAAPQEPAASAKLKPTAKAASAQQPKQQSESPPPPEQITIESYLAKDSDQAPARPAPPARPPAKKQKAAKAATPPPAPTKQIDWNDVAE
jgi:hypothetical protein